MAAVGFCLVSVLMKMMQHEDFSCGLLKYGTATIIQFYGMNIFHVGSIYFYCRPSLFINL